MKPLEMQMGSEEAMIGTLLHATRLELRGVRWRHAVQRDAVCLRCLQADGLLLRNVYAPAHSRERV